MSSFNRKLADLINDQGDLKSSKVDSFDSSEVNTIISSNVTGTAAYYGSLDSLPTTGLTEGQKALVKISDSVGRLYITDGSGWYNANTNLNTAGPTWVTEPDVSYTISDSVTPLTITALATDVDSDVLVDTSFAADSAQYLVTISRDSSVWTFTPKSADSIGESVAAGNLEDSSGEFTYTFRWNDGVNVVSKQVTISYSTAPPTGIDWGGVRAVTHLGYAAGSPDDTLEYNTITSPGNAIDFGNLDRAKDDVTGNISNGTRGIFWGGNRNVFPWYGDNTIQYITTATLGNSQTFGSPRYYGTGTDSFNRTLYFGTYNAAGTSDAIYGLQWGGYRGNFGTTTEIEYITVATTGNAATFGYFSRKTSNNSAWNDATRSVMYHGSDADYYSVWMKYLTTQTLGNATAITNSHPHGNAHASCSDATRGVTFGGGNDGDLITYNTTQNLSDATTFGNLLANNTTMGAASDGVYGVMFGGQADTDIEYVTIQTPGNSTDFGNLSLASQRTVSLSGNAS